MTGLMDRWDFLINQQDKWAKDKSILKGVLKFNIPSKGVVKFATPTQSGYQDTNCISVRKLPLALAKIHITKRLERDHPNIADKLELYQDKCADVLASAFIDHKTTEQINIQPLSDMINSFTRAINDTLHSFNERIDKLEENQLQVQKSLPKLKI